MTPEHHTTRHSPGRSAELRDSAELSRHDHHNLEIKVVAQPGDGPRKNDLDVYLFVPGSFQLSRWTKAELQEDFRARLRLAVPVQADEGRAAVEESKRLLRLALRTSEWEEMAERAKEAGAVFGETLKQSTARHRRRFLMAHALTNTLNGCRMELLELESAVGTVASDIDELRAILSEGSSAGHPILVLLDEFLSHLYVQYLAALRSALDSLDPVPERWRVDEYLAVRDRFQLSLSRLQKREAEYRTRFKDVPERARGDADLERHLVRLGQLKKYFQSRMFVDVARRSPRRRLTETTAAVGAACAGFFWMYAQHLDRPEELPFAAPGAAVACLWVSAYVLRDRMKDWARDGVIRRVSKFFPDVAQQLVAEGRTIGFIREWFGFGKSKSVPRSLADLRARACPTHAELGLPEEIFHYQRRQSVLGIPASPGGPWALQEVLRINVERYLKHMDDPFKELAVLNALGELTQTRSRRVYDFYVGIQSRAAERESSRLYRVVLHKKGIDRVEEVH